MSEAGNDGTVTPNPSENNSNRDSLPDWARKSISDANNEAAKFRTELRTKTDEHTTALGQINALTDEKNELQSKLTASDLKLLKLTIALDAGVPGDRVRSIAERLVGENETELKADAAKVVADFGLTARTPATDPSQGSGGTNPVTNSPASMLYDSIRSQLEPMLER